MLKLNDENVFDSVKIGKFLLVFHAKRCPLCPLVLDILSNLEITEKSEIQFAKIDFDSSQEAAKFYGIPGIPIVLVIKDGVVINGRPGVADADIYREFINELLN